VADYSGALVLELPTDRGTEVAAEPADAFVVGPIELSSAEVARLAGLPYVEVRAALADVPRWTLYLIGVAIVLVRHRVIPPPRARLVVTSDLPQSVGVASSAALQVATARALGAKDVVDSLRLAALCQEAENQVVGAPCGIMDQVTVAAGEQGSVLPLLCRPASIRPLLPLPPGVEVVGWPTRVHHDVGAMPYTRARAAAFMGRRIVEHATGHVWRWISELPNEAVAALPDSLSGADFLDCWVETADPLTPVNPDEIYPVRAATAFGMEEHLRCALAHEALRHNFASALGPLMAASHAGYSAMGLGHPVADAVRAEALALPGVLGARVSGGGSGGTVVVVCRSGSLDHINHLIR
jgi:L-arabinokinase